MDIRLIAFFTESHRGLAERFKDSFLDQDVPLELIPFPTIGGGNGNFQSESWRNTVIGKQRIVAEWIREHPGSILVSADVDIQFFRPIRPVIESVMGSGKVDIAFQAEHAGPNSSYNAGFIAMRCNPQVLAVFEALCAFDLHSYVLPEQDWFNRHLKEFNVVTALLPQTIWAWSQGLDHLSGDVVLHHANCTFGNSTVKTKFEQLDFVRARVLEQRV